MQGLRVHSINGPDTVLQAHGDTRTRTKIPDGGWHRHPTDPALQTAIEVIWFNETDDEFESEVEQSAATGINAIGIKVTAPRTDMTAVERRPKVGIVLVTQDAGEPDIKRIWRHKEPATNFLLTRGQVVEEPGSLSLLPTSRFCIRAPAAAMVDCQ